MSSNKNALFSQDSDESETEDDKEWKANNSYAENYNRWRRTEEISKLKSRFGEDAELSEDSETSDDEFIEPDNSEFDRDFLLAMGAIQRKAEKNGSTSFFKSSYGSANKIREEKPMTLKDYNRHIIMNRGGKLDDDDEEPSFSGNSIGEQVISKFDDGGVSSGDDDDDDLLTSGLFKVKNKEQELNKESDSKHSGDLPFVKCEEETVGDKKEQDLITDLKEVWTNPNNSNKEKWLADFFLNKRYLDKEDESIERAYNEVVIDEEPLSDDEETVARMEDFETKYRFRYEEPDQEFTKQYPRDIPDSLRQKDETRKKKRKAVKERKEDNKEIKRQEIQKLKALKARNTGEDTKNQRSIRK